MSQSRIEIRRSAERFVTRSADVETWHSFSFGAHYDPARMSFGALAAHNDERLAPGAGFESHAHRDVEIVTWVVSGSLRHEDSTGRRGLIVPGTAQRLSAGTGVRHSETSASQTSATRFIQLWITPDEPGGEPEYAERVLPATDLTSGLVVVASGLQRDRAAGAVSLRSSGTAVLAGQLATGAGQALPDAPLLHLFVVSGSLTLEPEQDESLLQEGDTAPILEAGDTALISGAHALSIRALTDTRLLLVALHP